MVMVWQRYRTHILSQCYTIIIYFGGKQHHLLQNMQSYCTISQVCLTYSGLGIFCVNSVFQTTSVVYNVRFTQRIPSPTIYAIQHLVSPVHHPANSVLLSSTQRQDDVKLIYRIHSNRRSSSDRRPSPVSSSSWQTKMGEIDDFGSKNAQIYDDLSNYICNYSVL